MDTNDRVSDREMATDCSRREHEKGRTPREDPTRGPDAPRGMCGDLEHRFGLRAAVQTRRVRVRAGCRWLAEDDPGPGWRVWLDAERYRSRLQREWGAEFPAKSRGAANFIGLMSDGDHAWAERAGHYAAERPHLMRVLAAEWEA